MQWWAPLAGLTGAVAVFAGLALIDKMGAGLVNGLIITTNLLTSLAKLGVDAFAITVFPRAARLDIGGLGADRADPGSK